MSSPTESALVLVGPMGAGKTSIGRRVAKALGMQFVDTDAVVVRAYGPIVDIFASSGEAGFRALERDAVKDALSVGAVVSTGGGSVLDPATRAALRSHRVAFLTVTPEVVAGRISGNARPLLAGGDAAEEWARIYAERLPHYLEVADATFDTSTGPLSDVVDEIAAWASTVTPKGLPNA